MSKRFVILSDLHAHPWTAFAKGDGFSNTRLQRSLEILSLSLEKAEEEGIPWIFTGDIVHTAGFVLNPVLSGISEILSEYPDVLKLANWGNHDVRGKGGRISLKETVWSSLVKTIPNLIVLDDHSVEVQELTIYGAGYQPRNALLNLGDGGDIGLFHQTVFGSRTPHGFSLTEGIMVEDLTKRYEVSIVGHIHHKQEMDIPGSKVVLIPGSPEHHDFGDQGEHGWWIFEYGPPHKVEFIPGGSPQFLTVDSPSEVEDDGNFYRVRNVTDRNTLPGNATFIAPEPTTVEHRDLLRNASQAEEVIHVWTQENPPFPHEDDCALGVGGESCDCSAVPLEYLEAGRDLLGAQDSTHLRKVWARHLILRDFVSYQYQELPFEPGLWLLSGANGMGKSTVGGEALFWLITGKNTKGMSSDEVVRRAEGISRCQVKGIFEEEDGSFLVAIRERDLNNGPSLRILQGCEWDGITSDFIGGEPWEAPGVKEMTQKLMDYLGLSQEIYLNLGYFSQENLTLFGSATDGERKDVLSDLMGLTAYQKAATEAGSKVSELSGKRESKRAVLETRGEDIKKALEELESSRNESAQWEDARKTALEERRLALREVRTDPLVENHRKRVEALERRIGALEDRKKVEFKARVQPRAQEILHALEIRDTEGLAKLADHIRGHLAFLGERGWSEEQARGLVALLPKMKEKTEVLGRDLGEAEAEVREASRLVNTHQGTISHLRTSLQTRQKELEDARAQFKSGVCPTCGQELGEDHKEASLQPFLDKVAKVGKDLEQAERVYPEFEQSQEMASTKVGLIRDEKTSLDEKVTSLEEVKGRLDWLDEHRRQEKKTLDDQEGLKPQAQAQAEAEMKEALSAYLERKEDWYEKIRCFMVKIEEAHSDRIRRTEEFLRKMEEATNPHLPVIEFREKKVGELQGHSKELEDEVAKLTSSIMVYEYWVKGFGKQGIQSLQMEEIAARFNEARGLIIPPLTQGEFDVQFSTLSTTRAGDVREKTDFFIFQNGVPFPYGGLSGGERRRVNIGIMLTMVYAVSEWMGIPGVLGLLTLDEIFVFLDAAGAEGLMTALHQVQKQIPTIFVMTHDDKFQSLFSNVIHVQKGEDGISEVM